MVKLEQNIDNSAGPSVIQCSHPVANRDLKLYDVVVNENATKQEYHWLKEEK